MILQIIIENVFQNNNLFSCLKFNRDEIYDDFEKVKK